MIGCVVWENSGAECIVVVYGCDCGFVELICLGSLPFFLAFLPFLWPCQSICSALCIIAPRLYLDDNPDDLDDQQSVCTTSITTLAKKNV